MPPVTAKAICALSLSSCALFLTACATKPPTLVDVSPVLPPPPSLTTPLPSTPYTTTAAQRMKAWRDRLKATQLMSAPTGKPGQ